MEYPLDEICIVLDLEKVIKLKYGGNPINTSMYDTGSDYADMVYGIIPEIVIGGVSHNELIGDLDSGYLYAIKYSSSNEQALVSYEQVVEAVNKYVEVLRNEPRLNGIPTTLCISLAIDNSKRLKYEERADVMNYSIAFTD